MSPAVVLTNRAGVCNALSDGSLYRRNSSVLKVCAYRLLGSQTSPLVHWQPEVLTRA